MHSYTELRIGGRDRIADHTTRTIVSQPDGTRVETTSWDYETGNNSVNNQHQQLDQQSITRIVYRPSHEPAQQFTSLARLVNHTSNPSTNTAIGYSPPTEERRVFLRDVGETPKASLRTYFEKYGRLVDIKVLCRNSSKQINGIVEFVHSASANVVLRHPDHIIDGHTLQISPFKDKPHFRPHLFLGGIPSHLTKGEIEDSLGLHVKVKHLELYSNKGYALLTLEKREEIQHLKDRTIRIGEKDVECKQYEENKRRQ